MRFAMVVVGLFGWIACASAQTVTDGSDQSLPAAVREQMMSQLGEVLKDPDSAKIRKIHERGSGPMWCGEINAKNSYGGYSGYSTFTFNMKSQKAAVYDDPGDPYAASHAELCRQ